MSIFTIWNMNMNRLSKDRWWDMTRHYKCQDHFSVFSNLLSLFLSSPSVSLSPSVPFSIFLSLPLFLYTAYKIEFLKIRPMEMHILTTLSYLYLIFLSRIEGAGCSNIWVLWFPNNCLHWLFSVLTFHQNDNLFTSLKHKKKSSGFFFFKIASFYMKTGFLS